MKQYKDLTVEEKKIYDKMGKSDRENFLKYGGTGDTCDDMKKEMAEIDQHNEANPDRWKSSNLGDLFDRS